MGGCIRLPCLIVSPRRRSRTADVGRRLEMHAHEMNVDPDLDGIRDSRFANLVRRTSVPTQRTLTQVTSSRAVLTDSGPLGEEGRGRGTVAAEYDATFAPAFMEY